MWFPTPTDASAPETCDERPLGLKVALPPTCTITEGGVKIKSLGVGRCNPVPCVTRTSQESTKSCCRPTQFRQLQVECDGFRYLASQIVSCGCAECTNDIPVTVRGFMNGGGVSTTGAYITINDTRYSVYYDDGNFTIETKPHAGRIVMQVKFETYNRNFMPQLVTVDVSEGVTEMHVEINLVSIGVPIINGATGGRIEISTPGLPPVVSVNIPPRTFVDIDGSIALTEKKMLLSFNDPRLPDGLDTTPGQFTFEDAEGETRILETRGVITLTVETDREGNDYFLNKKVTLTFDADALGIESGDSFFLWSIDPVTGMWKMSGDMTYRRRGGQVTGSSDKNIIEGEAEILPNVPHLNCGKLIPRERLCSIAVYVYHGEYFSEPLQGERVTAFMIKNGLVIGRTSGYTDLNGKACLIVGCGLENIVKLEPQLGLIIHPSHHLPSGFVFTNTDVGFRFFTTVGDLINGPVFLNHGWRSLCYTANSSAYHFKIAKKAIRPSIHGSLNAVEMRRGLDNSWFQNPSSEMELCAVQLAFHVRISRIPSNQIYCFCN